MDEIATRYGARFAQVRSVVRLADGSLWGLPEARPLLRHRIDLAPVLGQGGEALLSPEELFLDEVHFTPAGHEVVAEEVLKWLMGQKGWLPSRGPSAAASSSP